MKMMKLSLPSTNINAPLQNFLLSIPKYFLLATVNDDALTRPRTNFNFTI